MILEKDKGLNKMWQDYKEKHQYSKKSKILRCNKFFENYRKPY